jgi:hypothetical protein
MTGPGVTILLGFAIQTDSPQAVMASADDSAVYFERLQRLEAEMGEILKQGQQKRKV